jgi:uncharacterized membrane protein YjgN (DUF898 family)
VSTDVRRFLWSRTEIGGEQLEYSGDPFELLVGFMVLLAVLGPVIAVLSVLAPSSGVVIVAVATAFLPLILLAPLGVLALYQTRRYRVNHTIFRGLRFHQTGSAWIYALRAMLWSVLVILTLGLAYPWARTSLERYKMRHTFYGDVQGRFEGRAATLFVRGILGLLILLPGLVLPIIGLDESSTEMTPREGRFLIAGGVWLAVAGFFVYPYFRAIVMRWRIAGIRFGSLSVSCDFPASVLHKAYAKFFGLLFLLLVAVGGIGFFIQVKILPLLPLGRSILVEFIGVLLLAVSYFAILTIAAFAYQSTVRFDVWRSIVDHLTLHDAAQLDRAKADPVHTARHAGRVGAALNLGGF